jgi:hypothetical protein
MPVDPDDLLIFKVRRKGPGEEAGATNKPQETPPQEQKKPVPEPPRTPQPEIQLPKAEPKPPQVLLKLFPQQKQPTQQKVMPQANSKQEPKVQQQPSQLQNEEVKQQQAITVPKATPQVVSTASYQQVEEAIRAATGGHGNNPFIGSAKKESKQGADSRSAVSGMFCVWHPWRPAYAACGYCKRPFCFEDITEFTGNYYCLEDIDKVASKPIVSISGRYTTLSFVSSLLLFIAFFVFVYYNAASLLSLYTSVSAQMARSGFNGAIKAFSIAYIEDVIGLMLTLLGLLSGFLIIVRSRKSFIVSLSISMMMIIFFGYSYATSNYIVDLIIPGLVTLALIVLILSANFMSGREESDVVQHSAEQLNWSNTGRF